MNIPRKIIFVTIIKSLIWIALNIVVNIALLHFGQQHFDNSGDHSDFIAVFLNILFFVVSAISFFLPFLLANSLYKNRDFEHVILLLFALLNFVFVFFRFASEWPYASGPL